MESLYYFKFCVVIFSCCLKIKKKKQKKVTQNAVRVKSLLV